MGSFPVLSFSLIYWLLITPLVSSNLSDNPIIFIWNKYAFVFNSIMQEINIFIYLWLLCLIIKWVFYNIHVPCSANLEIWLLVYYELLQCMVYVQETWHSVTRGSYLDPVLRASCVSHNLMTSILDGLYPTVKKLASIFTYQVTSGEFSQG
jgi:hypothetical protein